MAALSSTGSPSSGRWTLESAEKSGYPIDLIYEDLARNVQPRVLNADAAMLEVLPEQDVSYDPSRPLANRRARAHLLRGDDRGDARPGRHAARATTTSS